MNELERMTIIALLESGNVDSAAFLKQCDIKRQYRTGLKSVELIIEVPMQQYRFFNNFASEVSLIEERLLKNAGLMGDKVSTITWTGMRTILHYLPVKRRIFSRAAIARYQQISERQLLSGDYCNSVLTARKAVEMVCVDIIARNHPNGAVPRLSLAILWGETKEVLQIELRKTVHSESIPAAIHNLDRTFTIAAGIRNRDTVIPTIKFKTVAADSSYIVNHCFLLAYFLYDTVLINMEEQEDQYNSGHGSLTT